MNGGDYAKINRGGQSGGQMQARDRVFDSGLFFAAAHKDVRLKLKLPADAAEISRRVEFNEATALVPLPQY